MQNLLATLVDLQQNTRHINDKLVLLRVYFVQKIRRSLKLQVSLAEYTFFIWLFYKRDL